MRYREQIAWPPGSSNLLPPGEVPMPVLQGPECGGSAANVRLSELRMPEEAGKNYSGIPVSKHVRWYQMDGQNVRVVTYRLGITKPENIDRFINFDECRLNKTAIAAAGGVIVEVDDDADGHDKSGKAVKIVTRDEARRLQASSERRDPHPLAPLLYPPLS